MPSTKPRSHKHFQLDAAKLKRAQRALAAKSETETVERALDFAIAEYEKNKLAGEAHDHLFTSGIQIKDAFGSLPK